MPSSPHPVRSSRRLRARCGKPCDNAADHARISRSAPGTKLKPARVIRKSSHSHAGKVTPQLVQVDHHDSLALNPQEAASSSLSCDSLTSSELPSNSPSPVLRHIAPLTASANRITTGRISKPNVRRVSHVNNPKVLIAKGKPYSLPTTSITPPTSPISTQDTNSLDSDHHHSSSPAANLALGFEPEGPIAGRHTESQQLEQYLTNALQPGQPSRGIYVCGTPGTGKTFTVTKVAKRLRSSMQPNSQQARLLDRSEKEEDTIPGELPFREIWINCANLNQAKHLFSQLADQLHHSSASCETRGFVGGNERSARDRIRDYARSSGPKTLVILDEVDFLTSKDQMVLYSAFEWPQISNSRIVLVGIANSIDLPVRLLPWLRHANCMPEIVSFTPYNASALQDIVKQRIPCLESSGLTDVAISLAAKKVAAGCGDARLMLDVCQEAKCETQRVSNSQSCIAIVSTILGRRGGLSAAVETIRQLPVQQQLALCVAANAVVFADHGTRGSGKTTKKASLGGLYDSFVRMCKRTHVSILPFAEFADICCNALTHHGLVDVPSKGRGRSPKTLRGRPIRLRVPIEDVKAGIAEKGFLPMLIMK